MATLQSLKTFCRSFSTEWRHVPSPVEAAELSKIYTNPEKTLKTCLKPYKMLTKGKCETISQIAKLNGAIWKTEVNIPWPLPFVMTATSTDPITSQENALLLSCEMLKNLGLLNQHGEIIDCKQKLLDCQEKHYIRWRSNWPIVFSNKRDVHHSEVVWTSQFQMTWPISLTTVGYGVKQSHAEQDAAARAIIKLKAQGFVDRAGNLVLPTILKLPFRDHFLKLKDPPDFEVFVDASDHGFGAYLFDNGNLKPDTVSWIQEGWQEGTLLNLAPKRWNSTFLEFYGAMSAVYTWKKKFQGRHVKVWTDNKSCADYINTGLVHTPHKPLRKYFQVLQDICSYYNIYLEAQHIPRLDNQAADHLAKFQNTAFRHLIPCASLVRKKSKKLSFIDQICVSRLVPSIDVPVS